MKIAPVHRALEAYPAFEQVFVHTGQHYDHELSEIFISQLGLRRPDYDLEVGSSTHAKQTAEVMVRLEGVLSQTSPDLVVVVGDVNSTLGAALAAAKLQIPLAHIEAGLRSFDRSMPEEINRVVTDRISDFLFAPSEDAIANLHAEGVSPEKVSFVGNVMIDSLEALQQVALRSSVLDSLAVTERGFLLATIHRPNNVDVPDALAETIEILMEAAARIPLVFSIHPHTRKRMEDFGLVPVGDTIKIIKPLGYTDFLRLMSAALAVLTDSGGIQEETAVLGTPCLTLRDRTERPITVACGTNRIVGRDKRLILATIDEIASSPYIQVKRPPLWDGHSAERIGAILHDHL